MSEQNIYFQTVIENLQKEIHKLNRDYDQLTNERNSLFARKCSVSSKNDQLSDEIKKTELQINEIQKLLSTKTNTDELLTKKINALKVNIGNLKSQRDVKRITTKILNNTVSHEMFQLNHDKKQHEQELVGLEIEKNMLESNNNEAVAKYKLTTHLFNSSNNTNNLEDVINLLKSELKTGNQQK